jgi:hypothetical protein
MTNVEEEKPVLGIRGRSETRSFLKEWFDLEFEAVNICHFVWSRAYFHGFRICVLSSKYRGYVPVHYIYGDAKAELSTKVCSITYLVFATASGVLFLIGVGIGIFRFGGL